MDEALTMRSSDAPVEDFLRRELARGDAALATIGPVLAHLLSAGDHALFSEETVSRVRGMIDHLARQLEAATREREVGNEGPCRRSEGDQSLAERLAAYQPLAAHCHAIAIEWQLASRLERRLGLDPVLSPLIQALIASDDPQTAAIAMAALASQARFVQQQRRMEHPLHELPADLYDQAIAIMLDHAGGSQDAAASAERLRHGFDESAGRLALLSRLAEGMGAGARAALALSHAGVALFLTALGVLSRQDRSLAALATSEGQQARLALSLRAGGLKPREVEEQMLLLHPDGRPPGDLAGLAIDRSAAILAAAHRGGA